MYAFGSRRDTQRTKLIDMIDLRTDFLRQLEPRNS